MARRVFFHIGLPKTGTTYLQTIMWHNRDRLRAQGMLLPGSERRDHLWSSLVVREDPGVARRNRKAPTSWARLTDEIASWPGDAVISHEFFAAASAAQAQRAVDTLAPAEVHVVGTGREPLGLFTASWQEYVKNKGTMPISEYGWTTSEDPKAVWDWRALDIGLVLDRWSTAVPPENVHVLTLPKPGSPKELLWQRFAALLGLDPDAFDLSASFPNESMGAAETEALRRINGVLVGFGTAMDRGVWIRSYLADERLVPRGGEKYWPDEEQIEMCRRRGADAVTLIRQRGFDVIGDVDDLLVPERLPERRHPSSVTDGEVAQVAVETIAAMLTDVRRLTHDLRATERKLARARSHRGSVSARLRLRKLVRGSPLLTRVYRTVRRT